MARTALTAQTVSGSAPLADVQFGAVDATNGNAWPYTGRRRLIVRNDSAGPLTVTVRTPAAVAVAGLDVPDRVLTVAAGDVGYLVESPEARQPDGMVYVDWSTGTTVTAALIEEV